MCQKYKPLIIKLLGQLQSTPILEPGYMLGIDIMGPSLAEIVLGRELNGPLERLVHQSFTPEHDLYATIEKQQRLIQYVPIPHKYVSM